MAEPLKPIGEENKSSGNFVNRGIEKSAGVKKRIAKNVVNYASWFVGVFLMFVVIVVFTTDIKFSSFAEIAELGLAFFVLAFCSYCMYVNFSDTGTRAGKGSDTYVDAYNDYSTTKKDITEKGVQNRLLEFCRYFVEREQENTRKSILADVGIDFDDYKEKYISMGVADLKKDVTLTKPQKKAISSANKIKPIKLTPEMFFQCGRHTAGRAPLGRNPQHTKLMKYITKFIRTVLVSAITSVIVLDVVVKPNWATFAACCLKLLTVVLSGFTGYKMGYENIVFDTVNYMSDQVDLMKQFQQYVIDHPKPSNESTENKVVETDDKAESPVETQEIPDKK